MRDRLVIKVEKSKTIELVQNALKLMNKDPQYRIPWIVFDRDEVKDFDEIIQAAKMRGVNTGWSNPCFEIWMYAYFREMPTIKESFTCCERFAEKFEKVTGQIYQKSNRNLYQKLMKYGNEEKAILIANQYYNKCLNDEKNIPSKMWPACTVQNLVEEIRKKMES